MSEFDIISQLFAPLAQSKESLQLGDDVALIQPPADRDIIMSVDAMVRGVHFEDDAAPELVAARLVGGAVSDIIAKGGRPWGCLLSFGRAPDWNWDWCETFAARFGQALSTYNMALWGGDTVSGAGFASLTVHGLVMPEQLISRAGARRGDDIYVTGQIGDGYLGRVLPDLAKDHPVRRAYAAPQPPTAFATDLAPWARASIDISDGLAADLDHMARASGCAMTIDLGTIPLSDHGQAYLRRNGWQALLSGGDDYQVAFTGDRAHRLDIAKAAEQSSLKISRIGKVVAAEAGASDASPVRFLEADGTAISLSQRGFEHFVRKTDGSSAD